MKALKGIAALIIFVMLFFATMLLQIVIPVKKNMTDPAFYQDSLAENGTYDEASRFINARITELFSSKVLPEKLFTGIADSEWVFGETSKITTGIISYMNQQSNDLPTFSLEKPLNKLNANFEQYLSNLNLQLIPGQKQLIEGIKRQLAAGFPDQLSNVPFSPYWEGQANLKQNLAPAVKLSSDMQNVIIGLYGAIILGLICLWLLYRKKLSTLSFLAGAPLLISSLTISAGLMATQGLVNQLLAKIIQSIPLEVQIGLPSLINVLQMMLDNIKNLIFTVNTAVALIGVLLIATGIFLKSTPLIRKRTPI